MSYEEDAVRLLALYRGGDDGAIAHLYVALRALAYEAIRWSHLRVPEESVDVMTHDAATAIVEALINDRDYPVNDPFDAITSSVANMIRRESREATRQRSLASRMADALPPMRSTHSLPSGQSDYVQQLSETDVGKRALVAICYCSSYAKAIRAMARYTTKAWIYRHAVELRTVYRMMHHGKEIGLRQHRRGGLEGDQTAVRPLRSEAVRSRHEAPGVVEQGSPRDGKRRGGSPR